MNRGDIYRLSLLLKAIPTAIASGFKDAVKAIREEAKRSHPSQEQQPASPPSRITVDIHIPQEETERYYSEHHKSYALQWWGIIIQAALSLFTAGAFAAAVYYAVETHKQRVVIERQTELSERPWLGVEVSITDNLRFDGASMIVPISMKIKNFGKSVASQVWAESSIILPDYPAITVMDGQRDYCSFVQSQLHITGPSFALFPGESNTVARPFLRLAQDKFELMIKRRKHASPVIVTCLAYRPGFDPKKTYITGVNFAIREVTETGDMWVLTSVKEMPPKTIFLEQVAADWIE